MKSLGAYFDRWHPRIEARLGELTPRPETRPGALHEAMRYALLGGGKRLRPMLCLAAWETARVDGPPEDDEEAFLAEARPALDAGCAVEWVHTYSLVHDDLPAMDNDDLRRGRLTTHKAFGEALAILAGDALLTGAFEILARALPPERAGEAVIVLAHAAGSQGMAGGQVLDLEGEGHRQDLDAIEILDRWKTGALFAAACRLGGLAAGAGDDELAALTRYGERLGQMFQIVDDILDVIGTAEQLGKTPGKDKQVGKLTYAAALGLDGARQRAELLAVEAKAALALFDARGARLCAVADYMLARGRDPATRPEAIPAPEES